MRHDADLVVVPMRASDAPARFEPWGADVVERCYELWSTVGGRNAEATVLKLQEECADDEPISVPTSRTVRRWAAFHAWQVRADADFQQHHGRELHELQVMTLAAVKVGIQNLLLAGLGGFDNNPGAGVIRLKASELATRIVERGVLPLMPAIPKNDTGPDYTSMTQEELAAWARGEHQAPKKKS